MRRTPYRPGPRAGFTLVELLVVITIIAILFALTSAAVVKALSKGDEVRVRNDITQLAEAIQAYKTHFQVAYLPSRFSIRATYDLTNADQAADIQYLKSVWPRLSVTQLGTNVAVNNWGVLASAAAANTALSGNQCLVLFLGGPDGTTGFSNSPSNPMAAATNATPGRVGPFFEFPPDRLAGTPAQFKDVYGSPFVYFSTRQASNDYPVTVTNTVVPVSVTTPAGTYTVYPYQVSGTAPNLTPPAAGAPRIWASKSGFQIISAGKDTAFGAGGLNWIGGTGGSPSADGYDDVANFHPTLLGIANN